MGCSQGAKQCFPPRSLSGWTGALDIPPLTFWPAEPFRGGGLANVQHSQTHIFILLYCCSKKTRVCVGRGDYHVSVKYPEGGWGGQVVFPGLSLKDSRPEQQHVLVECGTHGCSHAGQHSVQAANAFPGSLHSQQAGEHSKEEEKNPCCYYSTDLYTELMHMADEMICLQAYRKSDVRQDLFGNPAF